MAISNGRKFKPFSIAANKLRKLIKAKQFYIKLNSSNSIEMQIKYRSEYYVKYMLI